MNLCVVNEKLKNVAPHPAIILSCGDESLDKNQDMRVFYNITFMYSDWLNLIGIWWTSSNILKDKMLKCSEEESIIVKTELKEKPSYVTGMKQGQAGWYVQT